MWCVGVYSCTHAACIRHHDDGVCVLVNRVDKFGDCVCVVFCIKACKFTLQPQQKEKKNSPPKDAATAVQQHVHVLKCERLLGV